MWPFRRARSGNSAAQAVHTPSARREWASVDPMPLAVPPMTGTFGTAAFEAGLRSRQAPTFLEPLGHDLSPTAPAGLVSGLATPSAPSPSTTTVSRQTFDAPPWRARLGEPGPTDPVLAIPTAAPTIARLAEEAPGALTRAAPPSGLPTLQLSTVAPHETLNLAPVESTPQLAPTVATAATDTLPSPVPPPVPTIQATKTTLDTPDMPTADRGPLVGEAPVLPADRADTDTAAGRADTAPPNPAVVPDPPRRLGLGAPLPISHRTTSVQRSSERTGPAESTHGRPHSSSADVVAPLVMPPAPPVPETGTGAPEATPWVVQRTLAADTVEVPDAAPATELETEPPGPTVKTTARPLLSERPLPTASGIEATKPKSLDEATPVEAAPPPLVGPSGGNRPAPPVLQAASGTERSQQPPARTGAAPLQRLPLLSQRSAPHAPPASQKIPAWQRTDGSLPGESPPPAGSAPTTDTGAGDGLPLPADRSLPVPSALRPPSPPSPDRPTLAGRPLSLSSAPRIPQNEAPPALAAVQRQAAPDVVLSHGPVLSDLAVAPPRRAASAGSATVARLSLPSPPRLSFAEPAAPEVVQRIADVPDVAPPSLPAGEMPDVGAAAGTAAGAAGSAASVLGGALGNDQLEELAKGLYDKIRQRLKAELRLDRERYGRVTDLAR